MEDAKDLSTKGAREKLLKALVDSALESDLSRGLVGGGSENLPRRWLPHGAYHDLYALYCSHQLSSGEHVASSSTFYRVLHESGWKKKPKFSPPSSHSKCTTCSILRSEIQHAKGLQEHTEACDKLLRHLAGQFADRAVYHQCRSRAKTNGDLLCIITDSMDKSKYSLPRYHRGRPPKDVANTARPSLEVTTSMVHGVGIYTYLSDENQTAETNWVLGTLNRTLQHCHDKHQKIGKLVPFDIRLFADNTPKESWLLRLKVFIHIKFSLEKWLGTEYFVMEWSFWFYKFHCMTTCNKLMNLISHCPQLPRKWKTVCSDLTPPWWRWQGFAEPFPSATSQSVTLTKT